MRLKSLPSLPKFNFADLSPRSASRDVPELWLGNFKPRNEFFSDHLPNLWHL